MPNDPRSVLIPMSGVPYTPGLGVKHRQLHTTRSWGGSAFYHNTGAWVCPPPEAPWADRNVSLHISQSQWQLVTEASLSKLLDALLLICPLTPLVTLWWSELWSLCSPPSLDTQTRSSPRSLLQLTIANPFPFEDLIDRNEHITAGFWPKDQCQVGRGASDFRRPAFPSFRLH